MFQNTSAINYGNSHFSSKRGKYWKRPYRRHEVIWQIWQGKSIDEEADLTKWSVGNWNVR